MTATITAEKGGGVIRLRGAHLESIVDGLQSVGADALEEIARAAEDACTISFMLRATVPVTVSVRAGPA